MSKLTIEIRQFDYQPEITIMNMIAMINKRFKTPEQFETQLDTICLDIAMRLTNKLKGNGRCVFYHHTGLLLFDFTELCQ